MIPVEHITVDHGLNVVTVFGRCWNEVIFLIDKLKGRFHTMTVVANVLTVIEAIRLHMTTLCFEHPTNHRWVSGLLFHVSWVHLEQTFSNYFQIVIEFLFNTVPTVTCFYVHCGSKSSCIIIKM